LSSFLPVIALRGQGSQHLNASSYLRKGLIVFQFAVSMVFILGTIMMGRQIRYMINTDLGFKKDAIVTIGLPGENGTNGPRLPRRSAGSAASGKCASAATAPKPAAITEPYSRTGEPPMCGSTLVMTSSTPALSPYME